MKAENGVREQVQQLRADTGGRWLVTTKGSQSIWNLERMTYVRYPRHRSVSGRLERDQQQWTILQVLRWPRVGEGFHVLFEKPDAPVLAHGMMVRLRTSSLVLSIERLEQKEEPSTPR